MIMTTKRAWATWLCCVCLFPGCTEVPGDRRDASASDASQDADATQGLPDAETDASGLPIVTHHDFCGQPWFKLPVDGLGAEETTDIRFWEQLIIYDRRHYDGGKVSYEIHLFDAVTCTEFQLTKGASAFRPHLFGGTAAWQDYDFPDSLSGEGCSDLIWMDIGVWLPLPVPVMGCRNIAPVLSDRFVFFSSKENADPNERASFMQLDLVTWEVTELAPKEALVESYELSDRYLVWAAYLRDSHPESQGRTVLYKDLLTGEVTVVEASRPRLQYHVRTHGDYIMWEGGDIYLEPPSHLTLYHIPTGDSTIITEEEGTNPLGDIHGRVVALSTTRYRTDGYLSFWPSDVALYDIETQVMRRVTRQAGYLRAMRLSARHLLVGEFTGPTNQSWNWYVLDLRQLGLVDEEGYVLGGEPVFDPGDPPPWP